MCLYKSPGVLGSVDAPSPDPSLPGIVTVLHTLLRRLPAQCYRSRRHSFITHKETRITKERNLPIVYQPIYPPNQFDAICQK